MTESPSIENEVPDFCFRCGEPILYCHCVEEYLDLSREFLDKHGREPTPEEMDVLQPQTALEREHYERKHKKERGKE